MMKRGCHTKDDRVDRVDRTDRIDRMGARRPELTERQRPHARTGDRKKKSKDRKKREDTQSSVSRGPSRGTSCRRWVRGDCGHVGIEGLEPRASAATSGTETGLVGRRWLEVVAHASAWRKTSHRWPSGSGMCRAGVAKAARKCGTLENAREELH
ncbi:hypothetical protein EDB89DRAFT_1537789 [Lactarius sanguifluus]|nr:hypothetical protein EDB89DRAFT_1537789 [Lactarius sanguifluus]